MPSGGEGRNGSVRTGPAGEANSYLFPRHPSEVNRLDLQHYALRETLGANYLAPIAGPARILDVGSGTGQWTFDLCHEFPSALGIGVDLVPSKSAGPAKYRFVQGDVTAGLPFANGIFDFVHQRLLRVGIPVDCWGGVIAELVRVTRERGWVELAEIDTGLEHAGPVTTELFGYFYRLLGDLGLDVEGSVALHLGPNLARAGLRNIAGRQVKMPLGEWGGRQGSFIASDTRAAFMRLAPVLEKRYQVPPEHTFELLRRALAECERYQTTFSFSYAWGQRVD